MACPPDGFCLESIQTLIKFHMVQETDTSKVPNTFFQLYMPQNMSKSEKESVRELILKNETKGQGDVYIEGSVKQLKNFMKNHLVIKPACMFDSSIKVKIQVMFAQNGKYSDKNKRELELDLAQVVKPTNPSELTH